MKPNDENGKLPASQRPFRVLIISGSDRRQYNCPGVDWKSRTLMWNLDLYSRLDLADAWAIIGPINWYAPTSNLKLMFDRLVCMNGGNPREDLIKHKDAERAKKLENSPQWKETTSPVQMLVEIVELQADGVGAGAF